MPPTAAPSPAQLRVPVRAEPDGTPVALDADVFAPAGSGRHPAVLLAHGFGGSKADLAAQARDLAARGYVVLTYSARGFGSSGGRIHLDDPAYEVADARMLVDLLARRPDVRLDGPGDPRVGVAGGSYGGALALMLAGVDHRVDAVAALITWNDLGTAFFPQSAVTSARPATPAGSTPVAAPGPFKQLWASRFFESTIGQSVKSADAGGAPPGLAGTGRLCGRFDPTVCRLFQDAAETGRANPQLLTLLRSHSPRPTLARLAAPTLLEQGMTDSLFGLDQSDATARALTARHTPVAVRWTDGGHDGPSTTASADSGAVSTWLDAYLRPSTAPATLPVPGFVYAPTAATTPTTTTTDSQPAAPALRRLPGYPGAGGSTPLTWTALALRPTGAQPVLTPPGGQPASVTTIPALGGLATALPTYALAALPGQSAAFDSEPAARRHTVLGSPRLRLRVTSRAAQVTVFVSLWQVDGQRASQPHRLVAPVQVAVTPGRPTDITVALPAATYTIEPGSTWRVLVTSTDSAYSSPRQTGLDLVALAAPTLELPTGQGLPLSGGGARDAESWGVAVALLVLLAVVAGSLWRRRSRRRSARASHQRGSAPQDVAPLVVDCLVKTYSDGQRAVDDVSFRAEKGQVVGLLGPNGAGKTTTMRILMGLLRPDSGSVRVLGEPVTAGSQVLARVGALVEGPGFLPHLSGRENLRAYWAATGRPPEEAHLEEVLEVAALGSSIERPVRSYSQGMRQRLGIAQAMLGLSDLLVLDEPTNGLDPPQIAAMRPVLKRYAASSRTVVVSSHLLAEVEMTCSHVVVMHVGRVVATGAVADLLDTADTTVIDLEAGADAAAVARSLRESEDVGSVSVESAERLVVTAALPRAEVVTLLVTAGAQVVGVSSRRQLEQVFLGVIAAAQNDGEHGPDPASSATDQLRQVRVR